MIRDTVGMDEVVKPKRSRRKVGLTSSWSKRVPRQKFRIREWYQRWTWWQWKEIIFIDSDGKKKTLKDYDIPENLDN